MYNAFAANTRVLTKTEDGQVITKELRELSVGSLVGAVDNNTIVFTPITRIEKAEVDPNKDNEATLVSVEDAAENKNDYIPQDQGLFVRHDERYEDGDGDIVLSRSCLFPDRIEISYLEDSSKFAVTYLRDDDIVKSSVVLSFDKAYGTAKFQQAFHKREEDVEIPIYFYRRHRDGSIWLLVPRKYLDQLDEVARGADAHPQKLLSVGITRKLEETYLVEVEGYFNILGNDYVMPCLPQVEGIEDMDKIESLAIQDDDFDPDDDDDFDDDDDDDDYDDDCDDMDYEELREEVQGLAAEIGAIHKLLGSVSDRLNKLLDR